MNTDSTGGARIHARAQARQADMRIPQAPDGVEAASLIGGVGYPWLLGSAVLDRFPRDFLRESRAGLAEMLETFERLEVFADARYGKAERWLRWLGFEAGETVMFGDVPFHPFVKVRDARYPSLRSVGT